MGWKSTIDIEREEAERLILERLLEIKCLTNKEIKDMLEELGYGDDPELKYYGRNFNVIS